MNKQMREIDLNTKEVIKALRKAFDKAVAENKREFEFMGADFHTGYTRYLLSFFEPRVHLMN